MAVHAAKEPLGVWTGSIKGLGTADEAVSDLWPGRLFARLLRSDDYDAGNRLHYNKSSGAAFQRLHSLIRIAIRLIRFQSGPKSYQANKNDQIVSGS
jgi:hypothetical protein